MRTSGLLVLSVIIGTYGCKPSAVTTSPSEAYSEDLSSLRPDLSMAPEDVPEEIKIIEKPVRIKGGIKEELDSVNRIIIEKNKAQKYVDGYTIQIYTGNDREAANEALNRVTLVNPELEPTIEYYQPSYKVKVGQYANRLKAHEVFESLKEEFPLALLIPERIRVNYD